MIITKASSTTGRVAVFYKTGSGSTVQANLLTISNSANTFTNAGVDDITGANAYNPHPSYNEEDGNLLMSYNDGANQDRLKTLRVKEKANQTGMEADGSATEVDGGTNPVSYTHLTLPTICSV